MQSSAINKAMEILQKLRTITERQDTLADKLSDIVKIIAGQMSADAASCYIAVDGNRLELFASYGFNPEALHNVSFRFGEGLTGEVAQNSRTLSVADAWAPVSYTHLRAHET